MCGDSAVTSISERDSNSRIRASSALIPRTQCTSKLRIESASSRMLCKNAWAISGRLTLSSKLPLPPASDIATSLAIT